MIYSVWSSFGLDLAAFFFYEGHLFGLGTEMVNISCLILGWGKKNSRLVGFGVRRKIYCKIIVLDIDMLE